MGFTPLQRKVIDERGGNLLVSASAGSGKTTVMISRVLSLVLGDGVDLDKIVICTFTRAAASDMKDKLLSALMDRADGGDENAMRQLTLLPTAEISTIHSWCQRLLKTYFYALGVDPNFDICDEYESNAMLLEAITQTLEEFVESGNPDFAELYDIMLVRRGDGSLRDAVRTLYAYARTQADPDEYLNKQAFCGYESLGLCDETVKFERERVLKRYEKKARALQGEAVAFGNGALVDACSLLLAATQDEPVELASVRRSARDDEQTAELKERYITLKDNFLKAIKPFDEYYDLPLPSGRRYAQILVELARISGERYAEKKRKKAKLDYADLEHLTCKLIESEAEEIAKRYKYVFVDEYQDINPLQERIIAGLKGVTTFLVGDIKQSIYAFRMCDPGIFLEKYAHYAQHGYLPPVELNANFRSDHAILDITNEVFDELMTMDFGRLDYKNTARLTAGRESTEKGEVKFKIVLSRREKRERAGVYAIPDLPERATISDEEDETDAIVRDIMEIISSRTVIGLDGKERHARPSDIAVLYSSRSSRVGLLYEKLRRSGINATIADKLSFTAVYEVNILCEFMKYLTDFTDDIALVALLKSPLGGISDEELATVRATDFKEKSFYALCKTYAENEDKTAERLREFFALAERFLDYSRTHTAGETIGRLVAEKGWFQLVFSRPEAPLKADALESFLAHLNSCPYGDSVYEYVRYLDDEHTDYERPPATNAVRIMTIHASKGLEFPFVFLMNSDREFNFRELNNRLLYDGELGVCIKNHDQTERKANKNKLTFAAALRKKRGLTEERMRVLYVALTRARTALYIYACLNEDDELFEGRISKDYEDGKSFFDWMRPAALRHGYEIVEPSSEVEEKITEGDKRIGGLYSRPLDEEKALKMREYFTPRYTPDTRSAKSSVTAIVSDSASEEHITYSSGGENDDRALKKGNAYHKAMEIIDLNRDFESEWTRISPLFDIGELVDKEELRIAHRKVGELVKGKTYYREKQFIYSPDGKTLIQGVIDLMIVENGKCTVVDYKTSRPDTIKSGAYNLQLDLYMQAAEKIVGLKPDGKFIYSFTLGEFVAREE